MCYSTKIVVGSVDKTGGDAFCTLTIVDGAEDGAQSRNTFSFKKQLQMAYIAIVCRFCGRICFPAQPYCCWLCAR